MPRDLLRLVAVVVALMLITCLTAKGKYKRWIQVTSLLVGGAVSGYLLFQLK